MTNQVKHDPAILFRFALNQHDWVLADLLVRSLRKNKRATRRLAQELKRQPASAGAPTSFKSLHVLARLSQELGVDNGVGA